MPLDCISFSTIMVKGFRANGMPLFLFRETVMSRLIAEGEGGTYRSPYASTSFHTRSQQAVKLSKDKKIQLGIKVGFGLCPIRRRTRFSEK